MIDTALPTINVNVRVAIWGGVALSESWTANVKLPAPAGVPVISPDVERPRPGGSVPAVVHVYGGTPPVAERDTEYGIPGEAIGSTGSVVIVKAGFTTISKAFVVVCGGLLTAAWIVKLYVPGTAGVPDRFPVVDKVKPGGRNPESSDHATGGGMDACNVFT